MPISRNVFEEQRRPRFGKANPERMRLDFWEWMIRGDDPPPQNDESVLGKWGLVMREGILKSAYGPYRARDLFQVPLNRDDGPIWTFDRMGQTRNELSDGRIVCIGGEHEDSYDPDFNIYNDVVVLGRDGSIEIYGYPREIFPPTDFHTSCLIDAQIVVVGGLGYPEERRPGHTPVFALDLADYHITSLTTSGDAPGWIFHHEAEFGPDGVITVRGGEVFEEKEGTKRTRRNFDDFALNTRTGVWHRITNRQWRQFEIQREDHSWFPTETRLEPGDVVPLQLEGVEMIGISEEKLSEGWFRVHGCPVSVTVGLRNIEIVIHGSLSVETATTFADAVRAKLEMAIQQKCVLEML